MKKQSEKRDENAVTSGKAAELLFETLEINNVPLPVGLSAICEMVITGLIASGADLEEFDDVVDEMRKMFLSFKGHKEG